jgi:hypothetical protein
MEIINKIQSYLNAPKGQYNNFGKYAYRNCEDILEAVKPYLVESGATLVITDDMVMLGNRFYVKATATIQCGKESISGSAYARESEDKKGMDAAQITGAASSYARKYALNGLFCIDDNKDADSKDNSYIAPDNSAIVKQIAACRSIEELTVLWPKLSSKEQNINKATFSKAKESLEVKAA